METIPATIITGVAATALIDLWALARRRLIGTPLPDYTFIGRWISSSARFDAGLGWVAHYAIGIAFAFALLAVAGSAWFGHPTPMPALLVGIATVAAPFLILQPAMGAGIAASRTPRPNRARLQSLVTHTIFGLGLYTGALLTAGWR